MSPTRPILHNLTFYLHRERLADERAFYSDLGLPVVFEETDHICCFDVRDSSTNIAIFLHEEEPGRPAGMCELFFWVDDVEWDRLGNLAHVSKVALSNGTIELSVVDPEGNLIRLHRRPPPS